MKRTTALVALLTAFCIGMPAAALAQSKGSPKRSTTVAKKPVKKATARTVAKKTPSTKKASTRK